jgi:hypothetical protein
MNELDKLKKLAGLETSNTSILREDALGDQLWAADATQKMMHQDYELDQFGDREDAAAATALAGQQDRELNDMLGAADDTQRMMHQDYDVDQGSTLAGLQSKNQQQNQDQVVQAIQKGDDEIAQAEVKAGEKVVGVQQAQADADVQIKKIEADAVDQATKVGMNKDVNVAAAIDGSSADLDQLAVDTDPNAFGRMGEEEFEEFITDKVTELMIQHSGVDDDNAWEDEAFDDAWDKTSEEVDQLYAARTKQQGDIQWLDAHNAASDTDDFGNPLQDTDDFGNYQYDDRADNRNFSLDHQAGMSGAHNFESVNKWLSGMFDDSQISVINEKLNESPEYADVIKTMRNAGLSHDLVMARITEWANTPDGVGEVEPREHGDAYDMAQGVNLSLKRYLNAEDMKVTVAEHTVDRMNALYENFKKKS